MADPGTNHKLRWEPYMADTREKEFPARLAWT
jgi:hypothetical protein